MRKTIIIAIIAALLTAIGLTSDVAKSTAVMVYCKIQPHDCQGE